ncbi:MAG TPA: hypothetical protein QF604_25415, partial [Candidatus Latescibacteria bacterium]|nr:hypothetical protein [Candidatus Latescibacterota bacterium]
SQQARLFGLTEEPRSNRVQVSLRNDVHWDVQLSRKLLSYFTGSIDTAQDDDLDTMNDERKCIRFHGGGYRCSLHDRRREDGFDQ